MDSDDIQMMETTLHSAMLQILMGHDTEAIKDIIACLEIVYEEMGI